MLLFFFLKVAFSFQGKIIIYAVNLSLSVYMHEMQSHQRDEQYTRI